jgi:hypothetical protein
MTRELAAASPQRILFLRIGIDTGCGQALGPLFPDGAFEYVPIPERDEEVGSRGLRYGAIPARSGGSLARFVPRRFRDGYAHYDPEFDTFTYGDPARNKGAQLLRLGPGDLLVFYAGLTPTGFSGHDALYVIGYFSVSAAHAVPDGPSWPPAGLAHLGHNAHLRRARLDPGLVIVEGNPAHSRLLARAAPLSDEARNVLPHLVGVLGFGGSVKRAVGRWVPVDHLRPAAEWLLGL